MTGGSPDLDVAMLRAMNIGGCNDPNHGFALDGAAYCRACFAILVDAIRAETLEEAAKVCDQHAEFARDLLQQNPSSIHVGYRTGRAEGVEIVAAELRALTGSQAPNG